MLQVVIHVEKLYFIIVMSSMQISSEQIMVFAMKVKLATPCCHMQGGNGIWIPNQEWGVQPKAEKSDTYPSFWWQKWLGGEPTSHDTIPIQHKCIKIYNVFDFGGCAAPISPRLPTQQLLKLIIHFSSGPNEPCGIVQSFTALKITFSKSPAQLQANFQTNVWISEISIRPDDLGEMPTFWLFPATLKISSSHWANLWPIHFLKVTMYY